MAVDGWRHTRGFALLGPLSKEDIGMHVSAPVTNSYLSATQSIAVPARCSPRTVESPSAPGNVARIDFSRITPRQLQAYLDENLKNGTIDIGDASALGSSIPGEWYTERADSPIDLKGTIKGIASFDRRNGYDTAAVFYEGLAARMSLMEQASARISVTV